MNDLDGAAGAWVRDDVKNNEVLGLGFGTGASGRCVARFEAGL
jgi:hypothetical protein